MKLDEKQLTELTTSYPHVCKDTVIEVIDKIDIDKISVQELYDMYLDYKNKYHASIENSKKCQSDFFYWSYVADSETYQYLYQFFAQLYINKITPEDCAIGYLQRRDKRLEKLLNDINKTIEDLNLYKPTNYKKMIELLNKIK